MYNFFKKLFANPVPASTVFIILFISLFILANLFVGFVWPLYLLAAGVGFFISIVYPKSGILAAIFLTMIFERFFTLQAVIIGKSEYKIYPLDIILLGVFAGILLQFVKGKINFSAFRSLSNTGKEHWALAAFILLNVVYFGVSAGMLGGDYAISFSTLKNYAFYSLLYFVMIALVKNEKDMEEIARFFFLGAAGIMVFIIIGLVRGEGLWSEYTPLSTSGSRTLAFTHGLYLTLALIAAFFYGIFYRIRMVNMHWLFSVWAVGIAGTMMRHLWLALAAAMGVGYFFLDRGQKQSYRKKAFQLAGMAVAGIIIVFYVAAMFPYSKITSFAQSAGESLWERTYSIASLDNDESYSWRNLVWNSAWEKYKSHPLSGIGTGQKVSVENGSYRDFVEVKSLHNSYLSILVQFGIVGIALFLYFTAAGIHSLIKSFSNETCLGYKFAVLGMICVYLVSFAFQPYLETNLLGIFFWMSLGAGKAMGSIKKQEHSFYVA